MFYCRIVILFAFVNVDCCFCLFAFLFLFYPAASRFVVYRWTSLFYGDHDKRSLGSQESLDTTVHSQDKVSTAGTATIISLLGRQIH